MGESNSSNGASSNGAIKRDLFLVSLLFLFLELAFIRWLPAEVLFLTFFTNSILLACFLGLSLGCLAARHKRNYLALTPVLVLVAVVAGSAMESVRVALQDILNVGKNDASPQMVYFGTEFHVHDVASFVVPMEAVAGVFFVLVAAAMIGPGQVMGRRFAELKSPVEAYIVNIGGSLVGVLLFSFCSEWLTPVGWFGIAAAGLVYFLWRETPRKWWAIAAAVAGAAAAGLAAPRAAAGELVAILPHRLLAQGPLHPGQPDFPPGHVEPQRPGSGVRRPLPLEPRHRRAAVSRRSDHRRGLGQRRQPGAPVHAAGRAHRRRRDRPGDPQPGRVAIIPTIPTRTRASPCTWATAATFWRAAGGNTT